MCLGDVVVPSAFVFDVGLSLIMLEKSERPWSEYEKSGGPLLGRNPASRLEICANCRGLKRLYPCREWTFFAILRWLQSTAVPHYPLPVLGAMEMDAEKILADVNSVIINSGA